MEAQLRFLLSMPTSYPRHPTISLYSIIPIQPSALMSVYLPHSGCPPPLLPHQLPCILPYLSSPYPLIQMRPRSLLIKFPLHLPQVPCPLIPNLLHLAIYSLMTSSVQLILKVHLLLPGSRGPQTLKLLHRTMIMTQKDLRSKTLLLLKSGRCTQSRRRTSRMHREWRTYPGG